MLGEGAGEGNLALHRVLLTIVYPTQHLEVGASVISLGTCITKAKQTETHGDGGAGRRGRGVSPDAMASFGRRAPSSSAGLWRHQWWGRIVDPAVLPPTSPHPLGFYFLRLLTGNSRPRARVPLP